MNGSKLVFPGSGENETRSTVPIFVEILNDEYAEPREFLVCNFLIGEGEGEAVQSEDPTQVTVAIDDDDG